MAIPAVLWASPSLFGLIEPAVSLSGFVHDLGIAWLALQFAPVAGVFAMGGLGLIAAWAVAGHLHPHLGVPGAKRVRDRSTASAGST